MAASMPSSTRCELVAPGELDEAVGAQRVERDVDAAQPGLGEVGRGQGPSVAPLVVSARSTPSAASLATRIGQVGPHGRLAAGEADAVDAEALDQHPGDALDLLEREQLVRGSHSMPSSGMQ